MKYPLTALAIAAAIVAGLPTLVVITIGVVAYVTLNEVA